MPKPTLTEQVAEVVKNLKENDRLWIEYEKALTRFRAACDAFATADAGKKV